LLKELTALFTSVVVVDSEDRSTIAFIASSIPDSRRYPELGAPERGVITKTQDYLNATVLGAIERGELGVDTDAPLLVKMLTALLWGACFYVGVTHGLEDRAAMADLMRRMLAGKLWQIHPNHQLPI
jgi:hypothetical protein